MKEQRERNANARAGSGAPQQAEIGGAGEDRSERRGLFGRFNKKIDDAITTSRGTDPRPEGPSAPVGIAPAVANDDVALRRARTPRGNGARMIIPEGAVVEGSIFGVGETEIGGQVKGNVTVDGRLVLGPTAVVSGNVRAVVCAVEGRVEGKTECNEALDLGKNGRLNSDVAAGKRLSLAGEVSGNVTCGGMLNLLESGRVTGNIKTPRLVIEEGAVFNGQCAMRTTPRQQPQQQQQLPIEK